MLEQLLTRAEHKCELCGSVDALSAYMLAPYDDADADHAVLLCAGCQTQIDKPEDANHWRCLNDSMWSQTPAVQVLVWRLLDSLRAEGWPQDLLDMLYLEDEVLAWAKASGADDSEAAVQHKDAHGNILASGDTVTLIKDLNVKGGGFTAKRGTAVRNISLVADNAEHIEGRVSGQQIVILAQFVKKS